MRCKMEPFTVTRLHSRPSGAGYVTVFIPSSAYLSKSRMDKEASSRGINDFGLFPHIKPQSEIASSCTASCMHTHTHTLSLASLLIAQEILSAGGQLQARCADRMVEQAHYPKHRPHRTYRHTRTHTHTLSHTLPGQCAA